MLEVLERRVLVERQITALVAVHAGGSLADVDEARSRVLAALREEPEQLDPEQQDLMIALGLR